MIMYYYYYYYYSLLSVTFLVLSCTVSQIAILHRTHSDSCIICLKLEISDDDRSSQR